MAKNTADRVRYQHRPLKDHDSTRILHLQPGRFRDDIHVRLAEIRLSEKPSFEALSYVWGSPTPTDPISCHGEELLVTSNCIAAMRQLRHKYRTRVLWIDAICIDQNSKNERNHQVRLMGEIYSTAKRFIIWLGEGTTDSDFLMSFLKNYYRIWKYLPALRSILLLNQIKKFNSKQYYNPLLQPLKLRQSTKIAATPRSVTTSAQFAIDLGFHENGQYKSIY
jgi:sulfur relay (sulfurtransferase) DsrC/TusE family protein